MFLQREEIDHGYLLEFRWWHTIPNEATARDSPGPAAD